MVDPTTWVPSAAGTIPAPTAAAEPLLEPPGVRVKSHGFRVPRACAAANSVVTALPIITAPASRSAATAAASRAPRQPAKSGEPCSVGMSAVFFKYLAATGMPSIIDHGLLEAQRALDRSAAVRAAGRLVVTKAPISDSRASIVSMQRSRNRRGVSVPSLNAATEAKNDRSCGLTVSVITPSP